jgi:signal transduction histidine kinase
VPLTAHGRTLGAITLAAARSSRRYGTSDLMLARDLAWRAALAVENARLYDSAREAVRRRDEFLAMLAHELRNPLAPVSNALGILRLVGAEGSAAANAIDLAERQVRHLAHLVDDLLEASRVTRGKIRLRLEHTSAAAVVGRAVEAIRPVMEAQGHDFVVSIPEEPLWLDADPARLEQVLLNLLNNAAKYTPPGGHVRLGVSRDVREAVIAIRDDGVGIAAEALPNIFDMFAQADRSLDRCQGGLGVGLTLVKTLVEMHGGTVRAESEGVDRGSTLFVRLPLAAPELAVAEARG